MKKCLEVVDHSNESFDSIIKDITKATEAITGIADGIEKINDVAAGNAAATQEQAATLTQILELSETIVHDSDKISEETESLIDVSGKLNGYSSDIESNLDSFKIGAHRYDRYQLCTFSSGRNLISIASRSLLSMGLDRYPSNPIDRYVTSAPSTALAVSTITGIPAL